MVTFTPNIALAKPVAADLAKDWAITPQYADDNNVALTAASNFVVASYTPTWICLTTNPNIGAGTKVGEYWEHRGLIMGSFSFSLGAGFSKGAGGSYGISLPTLADSSFHTIGTSLAAHIGTQSVIGQGYFRDDSAAPTSMHVTLDLVEISGVAYVRMLVDHYTGKTAMSFAVDDPVVLAVNDKFSGFFVYKKAP